MNRFMKYFVAAAFLGLVAYQGICYAETIAERRHPAVASTASNVISNTSKSDIGMKAIKRAIVLNNVNPGTSTVIYVTNTTGTPANDGWVDVSDYNDAIVWTVDLSELGSTGMDVVFESMINYDDEAVPDFVFTKSFDSTDTSYQFNVAEEGLSFVRAGVIATGSAGADAITVKLKAEGGRR